MWCWWIFRLRKLYVQEKIKLVEECTENIDEVKIAEIALFEHENECVCSHTICVVLAVIALAISIGIDAYFAYNYMNHNKENVSRYGYVYQVTNC